MKSRMFRLIAISVATAVFSSGCMLSRLVDRAFLGITVRRPTYVDRKTTGVFLIPFTFVLDVATFPIQALLVVILGDNFPFTDPPDALEAMYALEDHPQFKKLGEPEKVIARNEFQELLQSKKVNGNTALALGEDGHWTLVELSADARQQVIARAQGLEAQQPELLVCER
ncbi:MAG: hypothetical protein DI536_04625 [Archangium gephyra]|uniref:Lipoprotein n=1 Tax=Archangium gephyra TaxID=48 RepID=A0A2W5TWC8_9BACT|nr:MAG: hypothetical protein DI536_04625 [Archangium gephyra]